MTTYRKPEYLKTTDCYDNADFENVLLVLLYIFVLVSAVSQYAILVSKF